jgi:hypothetical protein
VWTRRRVVDTRVSIEATTPLRGAPADVRPHGGRDANFNLYNEIANADLSFHRNGVTPSQVYHASDLLNCTTNPKAPVMNIYPPAAQRERGPPTPCASASRPHTCATW